MDRLEKNEKIWGGIFGLITIISAICEMFANGVNMVSIFAMIKDVAGTLVVVIVMFAVVRLLGLGEKNFSFEERLENALDEWRNENSNMIVKKEDSGGTNHYGLSMKTNVQEFYNKVSLSSNAGWFVRLPLIKASNYAPGNIEIDFHMNKGTFFEGSNLKDTDLNMAFDKLNKLFTQFINQKYSGYVEAGGKNADIKNNN